MIVNEQYIVEIPGVTTIEEAEEEFHNAGSVDTYYVEHYGWEFEEGDNDHLEEEQWIQSLQKWKVASYLVLISMTIMRSWYC